MSTIDDGQTLTKDPSDILTYTVDWNAENLAVGATISSQTVTVTAIYPSAVDTALVSTTTGSGLGIVGSSRKVALKLSGGTVGQLYQVTSEIVTNETPAQTKQRSFYVLIEQR